MSDPAPCSCRIAWFTAAVCAFAAGAAFAMPRSSPPTPMTSDPPTSTDARLADARKEADDLRRVYDDAQSALAQRDREIAAAEDELRTLRKNTGSTAVSPEQRELHDRMREGNRRLAQNFARQGASTFLLEWPNGPVGWATLPGADGGFVSFWGALPPPTPGTVYGVWVGTTGRAPVRVADLPFQIPSLAFTLPPLTGDITALGIHQDSNPPGPIPGPLIVGGIKP